MILKQIRTKITSFFWPTKDNRYLPYSLGSTALCAYIFLFFICKIFLGWEIITVQQTPFFADISSQTLISLTNDARQKSGLSVLTVNSQLEKAALEKAQDMISKGYFSHFAPDGTSPWYWMTNSGYNYKYAGENLAINFLDSQETLNAWLKSQGHRENIFNPNYREIGIAVVSGRFATSGENTTVVVQMFGSPYASASNTKIKAEVSKKPETKTGPKPSIPKQPVVASKTTSSPGVINTGNKAVEPISTSSIDVTAAPNKQMPIGAKIATNKTTVKLFDRTFSYGIAFLGIISVAGVSMLGAKPGSNRKRYLINSLIMVLIVVGALIIRPDLVNGALSIF